MSGMKMESPSMPKKSGKKKFSRKDMFLFKAKKFAQSHYEPHEQNMADKALMDLMKEHAPMMMGKGKKGGGNMGGMGMGA